MVICECMLWAKMHQMIITRNFARNVDANYHILKKPLRKMVYG